MSFAVAFQDGRRYCVTNAVTGYEKTVHITGEESPWDIVFDEDGNVNTAHPLYGGYFEKDTPRKNLWLPSNFLLFQPVDFDQDGIFKIVAAQGFEQNLQRPYTLGTGYCVLKYRPTIEQFEIVSALYLSTDEQSAADAQIPEQWAIPDANYSNCEK